MSLSQHDEQNGWLTLILGVFGGMALGFLGKKMITGDEAPEELTEEEEEILAELEAQAGLEAELKLNTAEEKPMTAKQPADNAAPAKPAANTAITNTPIPTSLALVKNTQPEKTPSGVSIVRRASFIAFKGEDFQLETGKYHCILDFFDTYYFQFLGDGFTAQGTQLFKFKAKKRLSQKAEIRFKLTDSCYNKLIYHVMIVDTVDPSKMTNDEPEES